MKNKSTREPVQKRSIEKKERIIEVGFKLMCEKGYHSTNTAQIAKAAGVSTGIVYQYFKDKHDIFLAGLQKYSEQIFFPILDNFDLNLANIGLEALIRLIVKRTIDAHKTSNEAHEQIMSLIHTDPAIAEFFHEIEYSMTERFANMLISSGYSTEGLIEKVHICVGLVDNLCHDMVFHNHSTIDYNVMTEHVINIIYNLIIDNKPKQ